MLEAWGDKTAEVMNAFLVETIRGEAAQLGEAVCLIYAEGTDLTPRAHHEALIPPEPKHTEQSEAAYKIIVRRKLINAGLYIRPEVDARIDEGRTKKIIDTEDSDSVGKHYGQNNGNLPGTRFREKNESSETDIRRFEILVENGEWQDFSNCKGANADLFFPERGASTRAAKAICRECIVVQECLDFAVETGEKFGIWGGKSERERRKIRKERQIQASG